MEWTQLAIALFVALIIGGLSGVAIGDDSSQVNQLSNQVLQLERDLVAAGDPITVEVEVPGESEVIYQDRDYLSEAVSEFLLAAEDEEDEAGNSVEVLECDGNAFDFDELSVSRLDDDWTLTQSDDAYSVDFEARLKYKEADERSCRNTYDVTVSYEIGEDTEVEAVLQ